MCYNSRLWERFQVQDINDRLDNLYAHLRDVVKEYGFAPPDYSGTVNEIKEIFDKHLLRVAAFGSDWEKELNEKSAQIDGLKDEIKKLRVEKNNYHQLNVLEEGINAYIEERITKIRKALDAALKETNEAVKQLQQVNMKTEQISFPFLIFCCCSFVCI